MTLDDSAVQLHRRNTRRRGGGGNWRTGMGEWEDVFRLSGSHNRKRPGCC
jgi:alpha/beta superfamily hydrolase